MLGPNPSQNNLKSEVQSWFKKFCKGNESLEDKECSGQSWEGSSDKLRALRVPLAKFQSLPTPYSQPQATTDRLSLTKD